MKNDPFAAFDEAPAEKLSAVYGKWGEAAYAGFQAVPDLLLKNQGKLELTANDLMVLLNILMHWWYPEEKPFPRPTTIARRTGVHVRTVQRSIKHMEELGLLVRVKEGDRTFLDPSPLVQRLIKYTANDADYQIRRSSTG